MTFEAVIKRANLDWERARNPEQKTIRRNAIIDAAKNLFSELKYEEISLNAIAREAQISKPNVYRYFASREEIFLAIFEEEQLRFIERMSARVRRLRGKNMAAGIARAWVATSLEQPEFLDLLPQLSISLEENSSVESVVEFKKRMYTRMGELIETLNVAYPKLDVASWNLVVHLGASLMSGLWPLANPGETVSEAMKQIGQKNQFQFPLLVESSLLAFIRAAESK